MQFSVDWTHSGASSSSVKVTHKQDNIPCQIKRVKHGITSCTFTPPNHGLYLVDVYVDDVQLPECPYECVVSDSDAVRARGDALTHAQKGKTARFEVIVGSGGRNDLDVVIIGMLSRLHYTCFRWWHSISLPIIPHCYLLKRLSRFSSLILL